MSEPYDKNKDPTLMGANGGYGGDMPAAPLTEEQDLKQRVRMWEAQWKMDYDERVALRARAEKAEAERDEADIAMGKEETAHAGTIDERDDAEQAFSQAYYYVIGKSPEWSNLFGHDEALEEIADALSVLKQAVQQANAQVAVLVEAYEDVSTRASALAALNFQRHRDLAVSLLRTINKDDEATKALPASATALLSELHRLRAERRTPGTVEVCSNTYCGESDPAEWGDCDIIKCPIKAAIRTPGKAQEHGG